MSYKTRRELELELELEHERNKNRQPVSTRTTHSTTVVNTRKERDTVDTLLDVGIGVALGGLFFGD